MGSATAEVAPVAFAVVLVNPLPIMAVILLLFSPRATRTAPAFVAGWVIAKFAALALLLIVLSVGEVVGGEREPSALVSIVRLLLGAGLLVLAVRRWRGRPRPGEEKTLPSWMKTVEGATPMMALGFGALLAGLNPKNLAFTVAAAVAIAQAELTTGEMLIPAAVYVLIASIGVVAPVIWYFVARERAVKTLAEWRVWLTANYAVIMVIVLLLFGVVLFARGLGGLIG